MKKEGGVLNFSFLLEEEKTIASTKRLLSSALGIFTNNEMMSFSEDGGRGLAKK